MTRYHTSKFLYEYIFTNTYRCQFDVNSNGDYIAIYNIDSNGNSKILAHLNGLDSGPKSQFMNIGNWEKKIISSLGNQMMIEFRSDDSLELSGFSASINYYPLQSEDCNSWLNMNEGNLKTPDYPNTYHNVISCKWLITVKHGYFISLKFMMFDVIFLYSKDLFIKRWLLSVQIH